jgi:hypothetical protein
MKTIIGWIIVICIAIIGINFIVSGCNDTAKTVQKKFNASALLKKYEYFKDLSSAIDKKRADIQVYEEELSSMKIEDKDDKFYYQQRKSEVLGLVSIYNGLVSDYNSQMSKFNYRFTNKGEWSPESYH